MATPLSEKFLPSVTGKGVVPSSAQVTSYALLFPPLSPSLAPLLLMMIV